MSKQQFLCRDALKPRTHNCIVNLLQINYFFGDDRGNCEIIVSLLKFLIFAKIFRSPQKA